MFNLNAARPPSANVSSPRTKVIFSKAISGEQLRGCEVGVWAEEVIRPPTTVGLSPSSLAVRR